MPLILTDVDETVLSFADPFQSWMLEQGYTAKRRLRDHYEIPTTFDLDPGKELALIDAFSTSAAMGALPPEPDAAEVLPVLHQRGFTFTAVSACVGHDPVPQRRRQNLENAFGFAWQDVHCVGIRRSKAAVLSSYQPSIWVEDHRDHANTGAALGHRAFLIDRPYNQGAVERGVTRVSSWHEIIAILETEPCTEV